MKRIIPGTRVEMHRQAAAESVAERIFRETHRPLRRAANELAAFDASELSAGSQPFRETMESQLKRVVENIKRLRRECGNLYQPPKRGVGADYFREAKRENISAQGLKSQQNVVKKAVATVFAHHVNNPLQGVLGAAAYILDSEKEKLSEENRKRLEGVVSAAWEVRDNLLNLIDEVGTVQLHKIGSDEKRHVWLLKHLVREGWLPPQLR